MTTNTLYTPLEELLFFQTLRANGINSESFAQISETLKANEFIHSSESYDPERLSPGSLQQLYLRLLKDEARSSRQTSPKSDGDQNGRKRKLSTPPLQSIDEAAQHAHLLPRLVDRLYARYKSHVIEAIKEEEKVFFEIQKSIGEIERGQWDARLQEEEAVRNDPHTGSIKSLLQSETRQADAIDNRRQANGAGTAQDVAINVSKVETPSNVATPRESGQHEIQVQRPAPPGANPFSPHTELFQPPPRPPSQNRMPTPAYSAASPASHHQPVAAAGPTVHGTQPLPPPSGSPIVLPPPTVPSRNAGSPSGPLENHPERSTRQYQHNTPQHSPHHGQMPNLPPHPHTLPQPRNYAQPPYAYQSGQPPYPQFHPYGQPAPGYTHQAQILPPYATPTQPYHPNAYQQSSPGGQHPHQPSYSTFPSFAAGQAPPRHPGVPQQFATPQPSTIRRQALTPINTTVSTTKWKSTPRPPGKAAPRSPTPPERSPMLPSSPEPSPEPEAGKSLLFNKQQVDLKDTQSRGDSTPTRGRGRGRWAGHVGRGRGGRNASSSHVKDTPTRSQSVASQADELSADPSMRRGTQNDPPSTPLPTTEDTSAMSTPGSAARPGRRNTLRGPELARPGTKRKRANTLEDSPEAFVPPTPHLPSRPGYVLASRNFPRIVAPLMNDINSHKLAAMFAKPITERDAPGYNNVIYRPTDLKSIRAAISIGSRTLAATNISDSAFTPSADETGAAATPPMGTPTTGSANKSGTLWVECCADVMPPRGIVNSAQLEKEITRMFANAVMFNLDPDRGFGSMLNRRRPSSQADSDEDDEDGIEGHYEVDDGGAFVRDAREMFEDVQRSVVGWRKAESRDTTGETKMRGGEGREESEIDELAADEEGESSRGRRTRG